MSKKKIIAGKNRKQSLVNCYFKRRLRWANILFERSGSYIVGAGDWVEREMGMGGILARGYKIQNLQRLHNVYSIII